MPDEPEVDLRPYKRTAVVASQLGVYGRFTLQQELDTIAQLGHGLDPRGVPVTALQVMDIPPVYFAERTISGIVRRPDLFSVRHNDSKLRAEAEAWLWPLLPRLLSAAVRAFAYGVAVVVLDWERKTLRFMVPTKERGKPRLRTVADHTHFAEAFEVHPDEVTFNLDQRGEVESVATPTGTFGRDRIVVWTWDAEFGAIVGRGARRRAWRDYCERIIVATLRNKYLERSVDSPRIIFAPDGKITVEGVEYERPEYAAQLLMDLRGSGVVGLPSVRETSGERKYEVQPLDLPDRADVWEQALNRCDGNVMLAYLVTSSLGGGMDEAGGAATKQLDGQLRDHIEALADWIAGGISRVLDLVHRANYDVNKVAPPDCVATDVGKAAARKMLETVLGLANAAARGEIALTTDVPAALDKLGVPLREPPLDPFAQPDPSAAAPPGPDRDPEGEREERREDGRSEEAEDDTGEERDE